MAYFPRYRIHGAAPAAIALVWLLPSWLIDASAQCVEFDAYLHLESSTTVPGDARDAAVIGSHVFVAAGGSGVRVLDVSNPGNPLLVGTVDTPGFAHGLTTAGNLLFVADQREGLQILDVSTPAAPVIVGSVDTPDSAFAVTVSGDFAYVADGQSGLQIVRVTNPGAPVLVGGANTPDWAIDVVTAGNYAYVADDATGLVVIDITNPADPFVVGSFETGNLARGIAMAGDRVCMVDWDALYMFDVSVPQSPQLLGSVDTYWGGFVRPEGVTVSGERAFVAHQSNPQLVVVDIGDPTSPEVIGTRTASGQGWEVAVAGDWAYLASGTELQVFDVSNPSSVPMLGWADVAGWEVAVADGYAYVVHPWEGLRVVDIRDVEAPAEVATRMTPAAVGVAVMGSHAYVADQQWGLVVFDVGNPLMPDSVARFDENPNLTRSVAAVDGYVYLGDGPQGLKVIDVTAPESPQLLGRVDTPFIAWDVTVGAGHAFVADGGSVEVIDVSDPHDPRGVASIPLISAAICLVGRYLFVDHGGSMSVVDVGDPSLPQIVTTTPYGSPGGFAVAGDVLYRPGGGLSVLDISHPQAPRDAGYVLSPIGSQSLAITESGEHVVAVGSQLGIFPTHCLFTATGIEVRDPGSWPRGLGAPNPARFATDIRFQVPVEGPVTLEIFDVAGRAVRRLDALGDSVVGGTVIWDGRDARGSYAPAGVYFYRMENSTGATSGKIVLVP